MPKKKITKSKESKKEKVLNILEIATRAWDVAPRGTVESGTLDKLANEIIKLK